MSESETFVKIPVTVIKNPGRKSGYMAVYGDDYPSSIYAIGSTAAEAKTNLTAKLDMALQTITSAKPVFAVDDQESTWAAIPAPDGGSDWYRIADNKVSCCTSTSMPASEAFKTSVGKTVLPVR